MPYSSTDRNAASAVGTKDTYAIANISASTSTIHGVQHNMVVGAASGTGSVQAVLRSGGTDYAATATTCPVGNNWKGVPHGVDPATSTAWTLSGVNAIEAGMQIATGNVQSCRLYQLYVETLSAPIVASLPPLTSTFKGWGFPIK
jgi:hypothetical protein